MLAVSGSSMVIGDRRTGARAMKERTADSAIGDDF